MYRDRDVQAGNAESVPRVLEAAHALGEQPSNCKLRDQSASPELVLQEGEPTGLAGRLQPVRGQDPTDLALLRPKQPGGEKEGCGFRLHGGRASKQRSPQKWVGSATRELPLWDLLLRS